jgi:hypothetical protein
VFEVEGAVVVEWWREGGGVEPAVVVQGDGGVHGACTGAERLALVAPSDWVRCGRGGDARTRRQGGRGTRWTGRERRRGVTHGCVTNAWSKWRGESGKGYRVSLLSLFGGPR